MFNEKLKITPSKKVNATVLTTIYCLESRYMGNESLKKRETTFT